MKNPVDAYWSRRLAEAAEALEANGFEARVADSAEAARDYALSDLIPALGPATMGLGGSKTVVDIGLYEALKALDGPRLLDSYDKSLSKEAKIELRRESLLSDLFFMGSNAVTEDGLLVNLDMIGNRVGALAFGPRHVLVVAGRNKIVPDLEQAVARVKNYAAPVNAMRLGMKTPCAKTGRCADCEGPERICNVWAITERCHPRGRIKVVLINEDLGL
ncbi:MAG: lactate utilization protein [Desulfovibrionaceae bacterium]|nr:lactate utilization protein [Desulfovibrionaceae bacterium]